MCGRFAQYSDIRSRFDIEEEEGLNLPASYNVAPGQVAKVILQLDKMVIKPMKWGLVTDWSKERSYKLINVRTETLLNRKTFYNQFKLHRCLIPVDGFYEWKQVEDRKIPYYITRKDKELLLLAGLWNVTEGTFGNGSYSFSIVTTGANILISEVHDRMPVIIQEKHLDTWLDTLHFNRDVLKSLLLPFSEESIEIYPVSYLVNSPANNFRELIEPV